MADRWDEGAVELPAQMNLVNHGSYLEISRRWRGITAVILTGFCVFWWFILLKILPELFSNETQFSLGSLIPIPHFLAGVGMGYFALASWFNTSYIYADHSNMEIMHKPFPWFGAKKIEVSQIGQIYVKKKVSRSKNSTSVSYEVRAKMHSGKDIKILSGLPNDRQAIYVEQQLEEYLQIEDKRVRGEY
ncbi:hypothetical protein [Sneathiella sp.]|uniref:hypothetical protein n=1 Tax=Sneathiella sp. TaxID=1964365 RepID=UPI0039E4D808